MTNQTAPTIIKKYANRRLYNTASSAYVTLEDLAVMVKAGDDFQVFDAKTGEDITRSVLTQIIFEQEGKQGQALLPTTFLRQLIRFYGDSVQALLPSFLEFSIDRFSGEHQKFRDQVGGALGGTPFAPIEELTRKNMAMFSQALRMFAPFGGAALPMNGAMTPAAPPQKTPQSDLDEMKRQLSEMKKQLDSLADKR
jgi:polyhydroxyalkanoate synthesis repressor PhaR